MATKRKTFCRICQALCGLELEIDGDRVVSAHGDFDHPMSRGYTCEKGRQIGAHLANPQRLRASLARGADGTLAPVASEAALAAAGTACGRSSSGTGRARSRPTPAPPRT